MKFTSSPVPHTDPSAPVRKGAKLSSFTGLALLAVVMPIAGTAVAVQRPAATPVYSADIKTAPEAPLPSRPAEPRPARDRTARAKPTTKPTTEPRTGVAIPNQPAHMYYDLPGDGALWVLGQDYKMSFGQAGATYYPRFGARQPHNVPLALSPDVVTSNGAAVAFDGAAAAMRSGDRVEIDRGAFVEAYDLTPQSIEQTFVFKALPSRGDLVVHIPATCELESRTAAEGLEFRNEFAQIKYGRAVAIDANGRRFETATELVGGSIELRVDAESVRAATLPLVIDPVVATFPIDSGPNNTFSCDVAWNDNYFCWFVVYEVRYSLTDHDVYARIMNVDGTTRHEGYVDYTTQNWTRPRCGALAGANQFLVVAGTNGVPSVRGREVSAYDLAMFSQFDISRVEDGDSYGPVVGGDPYPGLPSSYAVAYQRTYAPDDWDILVRRVNPDNTLADAGPIFLSNSAGTLDDQPAISKSNDAGEWMITWDRLAGPGTRVFGARVEYNSVVTQGPFQIAASLFSSGFPSVSSPLSGTHEYLVAYDTATSSTSPSYDIALVLVNGTTTVSEMNLSVAENFNPDLDQALPSVDCDGTHFAVAYTEEYSGADSDVYISELGLSGGALALLQAHQNLAFSTSTESAPAIASYRSSGGALPGFARRYVAAWQDVSGGNGNIEGGMFDGQEGGLLTPICFGDTPSSCPCGNAGYFHHGCASSINPNGAVLQASGTASVALDSVVLQGYEMSNGPCLYFQGTTLVGSFFGDGLRCAGGTTRRLGTVTNVGGSSQYPSGGAPHVSVSGQIPSSGGTFIYQAWYRNSASFCTSSTFNLSNGLQIVWTP